MYQGLVKWLQQLKGLMMQVWCCWAMQRFRINLLRMKAEETEVEILTLPCLQWAVDLRIATSRQGDWRRIGLE